jgi:hypothetical protein
MPALPRPLPGLTGPGRRARWRRSVARRVLAAACAAGAVTVLAAQVRPPPPATVTVVRADAPVRAGAVLDAHDLVTARVPDAAAEPGALTDVAEGVGRRTGSALVPGETVTRSRLVPRTAAEGLGPGQVALHVVLADPDAADVLHPGQPVLVVAATGGEPLARAATLLAADPPTRAPAAGLEPTRPRGVLLALPREEAERVLGGHGGVDGPVVVNVVGTG